MLFCSHIESPAHLGNKKPAWGLWWHNLSSGLWVGGWMGLNPLCHTEITFVTGVPRRPIHRLVDCRLFRMWNGFGTAACLFSKSVPPRMRRASCPFSWEHHRLAPHKHIEISGLCCLSESMRMANAEEYCYMFLLLSGPAEIIHDMFDRQSVTFTLLEKKKKVTWFLFAFF